MATLRSRSSLSTDQRVKVAPTMSKENPSNTDVDVRINNTDEPQQKVIAKTQKLTYFQMISKHQPNYNSIIGSK